MCKKPVCLFVFQIIYVNFNFLIESKLEVFNRSDVICICVDLCMSWTNNEHLLFCVQKVLICQYVLAEGVRMYHVSDSIIEALNFCVRLFIVLTVVTLFCDHASHSLLM